MDLVFDIGANVGNTVDIFIKYAKKVVAFEPNPELWNQLRYKFNKKNVTVDPRAISNRCGIQNFYISDFHTLSTFSEDWIQNSRFSYTSSWNLQLEVETTTLEKIIDEYGIPDYIKIDIEGYEFEVLTSFNRLLEKTIIAFEWSEEELYKLDLILKHLYNLGYQNFYLASDDNVLIDHQISWIPYQELDVIKEMDANRKEKWGMVYTKK